MSTFFLFLHISDFSFRMSRCLEAAEDASSPHLHGQPEVASPPNTPTPRLATNHTFILGGGALSLYALLPPDEEQHTEEEP
jgi:hypothetical protein